MDRALSIVVDQQRCVGNAQCVTLAPGVFRHNDNVQSEVVDPTQAPEAVIFKAARFCPTGAITVRDATTGEQLFP